VGRASLKLAGRFDKDRLLAYANPPSTETRLRADVTSFPLVIFYGAGIEPVTFRALLNGNNISGRFAPEPEGYQIVRIPLMPGVNTLVHSSRFLAPNPVRFVSVGKRGNRSDRWPMRLQMCENVAVS
jgi:hypothetical protein